MAHPGPPRSPQLQRYLDSDASNRRKTSPYTPTDRLQVPTGPRRYSDTPLPPEAGPESDMMRGDILTRNHNRFTKYSPSSLVPTLPTTNEEDTNSTESETNNKDSPRSNVHRRPSRVSDFPLPPGASGVHDRRHSELEHERRHSLSPSNGRRPSAGPSEGRRPSVAPSGHQRPSGRPVPGLDPFDDRPRPGGPKRISIDVTQLPTGEEIKNNKENEGKNTLFDGARKQSIFVPVSPDGPHALVDVDKVEEKQKEYKDLQNGKKKDYCCKALTLILFLSFLSLVPYAIYNYLKHKDMLISVEKLISNNSSASTVASIITSGSHSIMSFGSPGKVILSTKQNVLVTTKKPELSTFPGTSTVTPVPSQKTKRCANGEKYYRDGCTAGYYVCDNGVPKSMQCTWMLVFDIQTERCQQKTDVAGCS